jgi:hypothetical protein
MTSIDLDHTHKRLMAALRGIAEGKGLSDTVPVQPFGQSTKIVEALNHAVEHLKEPFHADDLGIVDQAMTKLGLARTSDQKDEIARMILKALINKSR